ncbi:MAG: DUF4974 domain-containing protein [Bacteroidetes bacterium]|nr:MAG: DUF4974 domain-containing protein [Bacteroidota bacterium]
MNEKFLHLATRSITAEASPAEKQELELMLQDPEMQKAFEELEAAWKVSSEYTQDTFAEADWAKMQQRIQGAPPKSLLQRYLMPMSIAASLILLIGFAANFYGPFAYDTIEATAGNLAYTLPDQSQVILKEGSTLRYRKQFASHREMELKGEAFFIVTKDPAHPFQVETAGSMTTVLGTQFNIREDKNYHKVEIHVKEGKVRFGKESNELILEKGMSAFYNEGSGEVANLAFGTGNRVRWFENRLVFENAPMETVAHDLSEYFGMNISVDDASAKCPFTSPFENKSWEDVKHSIELSTGVIFKQTGDNTWIIEGGNCH